MMSIVGLRGSGFKGRSVGYHSFPRAEQATHEACEGIGTCGFTQGAFGFARVGIEFDRTVQRFDSLTLEREMVTAAAKMIPKV